MSRAAAAASGGWPGKPEQPRQVRGHHRRPIADREHRIDRAALDRLQHRIDRAPFFVEANGNGAVAPRIVELIAAVGGVEELDAKARRRFGEHARLIAGGRREKKDALHNRATCSAVGSAQQYQGSFIYGIADLEGRQE